MLREVFARKSNQVGGNDNHHPVATSSRRRVARAPLPVHGHGPGPAAPHRPLPQTLRAAAASKAISLFPSLSQFRNLRDSSLNRPEPFAYRDGHSGPQMDDACQSCDPFRGAWFAALACLLLGRPKFVCGGWRGLVCVRKSFRLSASSSTMFWMSRLGQGVVSECGCRWLVVWCVGRILDLLAEFGDLN